MGFNVQDLDRGACVDGRGNGPNVLSTGSLKRMMGLVARTKNEKSRPSHPLITSLALRSWPRASGWPRRAGAVLRPGKTSEKQNPLLGRRGRSSGSRPRRDGQNRGDRTGENPAIGSRGAAARRLQSGACGKEKKENRKKESRVVHACVSVARQGSEGRRRQTVSNHHRGMAIMPGYHASTKHIVRVSLLIAGGGVRA